MEITIQEYLTGITLPLAIDILALILFTVNLHLSLKFVMILHLFKIDSHIVLSIVLKLNATEQRDNFDRKSSFTKHFQRVK